MAGRKPDHRIPIDDRREYDNYVAQMTGQIEMNPSDYTRYVISAYAYFRSRLLVPGRCYEDNNHGTLAIGGSAHADIIDLDKWLLKQNGNTSREALDWVKGSSLEQVAYWRGMGHGSTIKRRRDKIIRENAKNVGGKA